MRKDGWRVEALRRGQGLGHGNQKEPPEPEQRGDLRSL